MDGILFQGHGRDIKQETIPLNSYKLISLENTYPSFNINRLNSLTCNFWEDLKIKYRNRCACCGSMENKKNFLNPSIFTKLQKGHKNPIFPLTEDNIIPQCQECNRADKNRWIYDEKGRVIGLTVEALLDRIKKVDKSLS